MAGAIRSVINIAFNVEGAKRVKNSIKGIRDESDHLNKSQTRMGQASASAGRAFSAQSNGLGGLVAAYAGAAATIFAVQQAFSALQKAAQTEQIIAGTNALAGAIGQSGDKIISKIQAITKNQLTMAEAAQNINIGLSAGFNEEQLSGLADVSLKASRALGRNLTDALQRVIRGTAKLEPELLDELGIFTRIDPAVEKYAQSLNRSTTSLTDFEKRQAFVNAALEEGQRKFGDIDTETGNAQESLEKFSAKILDMGTFMGLLIADNLKPFIEFFSIGGNALVAFGALATIVFAKAFSLGAQALGGLSTRLQQVAVDFANLTLKGTDAKEVLENISESSTLKGAITGKGKLVGRGTSADAFNAVKSLQSGNLNAVQAVEQLNILKQQNQEIKKQIPLLEKKAKTNAKSAEQLEIARTRQTHISNIISELDPKLGKLNTRTVKFANSFKLVTTNIVASAAAVATLASRLLGIFGIFSALSQIVGQAFGVDILGGIFEWFKKLVTESRQLNKTIEAIAAATKSDSFAASLSGLSEEEQKSIGDIVTNAVAASIKNLKQGETTIGSKDSILNSLSLPETGTFSQKAIGEINPDLIRDARTLEGSRKALIADLKIMLKDEDPIALEEAIRRVNEQAVLMSTLFSQVNSITGTTFSELTNTAKGFIMENGKLFVSLNGIKQQIGELGKNGFILTKGQEEFSASVVDSTSVYKKFAKELEDGSINADSASLRLIRAQNQLKAAKEAAEDAGVNPNFIKQMETEVEFMNQQVNAISLREKFQKDLNSALSKEIKLLDTLFISGKASLSGGFANDEIEQAKNRAEVIKTTIKQGLELKKSGKKLNKEEQDLVTATNTAMKASVGFMVKLIIESRKIVKQEEKRLRNLRAQQKVLELQLSVEEKQLNIEKQKINATNQLAIKQHELSTMQEQLKIQEKSNSLFEAREKAESQLIENRIKQLEREKSTIQRQGDRAISATIFSKDIKLSDDQVKDRNRDFGRFFGPDRGELRNRELRDAQTNLRAELQVIELRKQLANNIFDKENEIAQQKRDQILKELNIESRKISQNRILYENQLVILDKQSSITKQQINNTITDLRGQKELISLQKEVTLQQITNEQAAQRAELDLIDLRLSVVKTESEIFENFGDELTSIFNQAGKSWAVMLGITESAFTPIVLADTAKDSTEEAKTALLVSRIQSGILANTKRKQATNSAEGRVANIDAQISGQQNLLTNEDELLKFKKESLQLERDTKLQEILNKKSALRAELAGLNESETARKEILKGTLEDLNREHELVKRNFDTRQAALEKEKDIISQLGELVKNNLTSAFNDFFNTIFTEVLNGTKSVGDAMRDLFRNILTQLIQDITQKLIVENLSKAASSIGSSILSSLSFASGGPVKAFAHGGLVENFASGGSKRDSVPAMLEPGEFVMRKRAVQQVGVNNLRDMNRGHGGQQVAPQINIINKGTPQTSEGQPKIDFNGKQMVVDIVTTDIRNNGPIRKSIQGLRK